MSIQGIPGKFNSSGIFEKNTVYHCRLEDLTNSLRPSKQHFRSKPDNDDSLVNTTAPMAAAGETLAECARRVALVTKACV